MSEIVAEQWNPVADYDKLKCQLILHEGVHLMPYLDTIGNTTIGVGRNLTAVGISASEAGVLFVSDVNAAIRDLSEHLPWAWHLDDFRYMVLVDMTFNLGISRLLKFKKFLAAAQAGQYDLASAHMLESVWAGQVKTRAKRLSRMMKTGRNQIDQRTYDRLGSKLIDLGIA